MLWKLDSDPAEKLKIIERKNNKEAAMKICNMIISWSTASYRKRNTWKFKCNWGKKMEIRIY